MKLTSAEANKMLNKLNADRDALLEMERQSQIFTAATVENVEDARPEYSYEDTREKVVALDEKVRQIKHALNLFNVSQELPGFSMTIDQALVYIPQLTQRVRRLSAMRLIPKKIRNTASRSANLIEYDYANFDPERAEADYKEAADTLARLQNALDLVNSTVNLEIEL